MEKGIFISELNRLAQRYNIRVWVAEKMGKRWSYVVGAGEEFFLPSQMIAKIGKYALFVEGESFNREVIADSVRKLFESQNFQGNAENIKK